MKGVIFNLLEEVVEEEYGPDTWDGLLQGAGLDGAYSALGTYPDEELFRLIGAASSVTGQEPDEIVRWFGRQSLPKLARRYPEFLAPHRTTRAFLLTLNEVIHPEVRKLLPGAEVPTFAFDASQEDILAIDYRSSRRLCALAEGFIQGAATCYGEEVSIAQSECMKRGDERCLLLCCFAEQA
ncbi:MAG TPA: heme NO-binding domain-containing protein [Nitriliruptorales bacterium]|nr:heme NO-binding domain-containing protein [Nitriliruptorales bacterium]